MTDKVQKIRVEVERLQNELIQEKEKGFSSDVDDACILELQNVLTYIDSLQEEPVNIWHDASEEPNGDDSIIIAYDNTCTVEPSFRDFKSYSEWKTIKIGYRVKQWAYVNDVLNLTKKEEPVSEELEEAAKRYATEGDEISGLYVIDEEVDAFKAGAKWQEKQDQSTIELAEDHATLAGMEKMKEEMMAKAVDATVTDIRTYKEENEIDFTIMLEKGIVPYELEDELKVIVIKEDKDE